MCNLLIGYSDVYYLLRYIYVVVFYSYFLKGFNSILREKYLDLSSRKVKPAVKFKNILEGNREISVLLRIKKKELVGTCVTPCSFKSLLTYSCNWLLRDFYYSKVYGRVSSFLEAHTFRLLIWGEMVSQILYRRHRRNNGCTILYSVYTSQAWFVLRLSHTH